LKNLEDSLSDHGRFIELAALATAGALPSSEMAELTDHLPTCANCREICRQYQILVSEGFAVLAGGYDYRGPMETWDSNSSCQRLFARIEEAEEHKVLPVGSDIVSLKMNSPHRTIKRAALAAAVAACLLISVTASVYLLRNRRHVQGRPDVTSTQMLSEAMLTARRDVDPQLTEQMDRIAKMERESSAKALEIEKLRKQIQILQDRMSRERASADAGFRSLAAEKANFNKRVVDIAEERDRLSEQLREVSRAYQGVQAELSSVRAERDRSMLRMATLELQADHLNAVNLDQEQQLKKSQQYLSSDHDIRELLGARNLYIADVFDVEGRNRTRRPFGRIFYTQGRSLILYAFDLDRQPKVTKASTFQVWGQRETIQEEQARPRNLGLLYLDSEASRRWILRFDDAHTLSEIDAVFVTVEPNGGSPAPTGKPLLFALLRKEANHP